MADKQQQAGSLLLPVSRIRTIMKSSPEVSNIGMESLFLIGRATELFIQDLAARTLRKSADKKSINYSELAEIVHKQDTLAFLQDIIPEKVRYREAMAMIALDQ